MHWLHWSILVNISLLHFPILTNPYQYIITLYGLCNVFLINFDSKISSLWKLQWNRFLLLEFSKRSVVTLLKLHKNILNPMQYINNFNQKMRKVSIYRSSNFIFLIILTYHKGLLIYLNNLSNDVVSNIKQMMNSIFHCSQCQNLSLWNKLKFEK